MKRLDCETIESTYNSLETILGLKKSDLHELFDSIDVYEETQESFSRYLLSYIQKETCCKPNFDASCFFHATRTWPGNTYEDGLLPTKQAEDKICCFLSKNGKGQATVTPGGDAMVRQNKYINGGPFGLLIRDFTLVRDPRYVNYFDVPEIVEDIGLKEQYQKYTIPCIVKFVDQWTPATRAWKPIVALSTALLYAYHDYHKKELGGGSELSYAFVGNNNSIPQNNILKVEFPANTTAT